MIYPLPRLTHDSVDAIRFQYLMSRVDRYLYVEEPLLSCSFNTVAGKSNCEISRDPTRTTNIPTMSIVIEIQDFRWSELPKVRQLVHHSFAQLVVAWQLRLPASCIQLNL